MAESSPAAVPESIENEVSVSSFVAIKAIGGFQRVETKLCFLFTEFLRLLKRVGRTRLHFLAI